MNLLAPSAAALAMLLVPKTLLVDGLGGLQLHHRHVLVGRGVEDQLWPEALEDEAHALGDRDVANEDLRVVEVLAPELLVQVVEPALVSIEQYQASRTEARDLARELLADGSAGAGYQTRLPLM